MSEYPAKYTVFWPGQTIHACDRHMRGIENLSRAMGAPIPDRREEAGHQCENCVKEANKEAHHRLSEYVKDRQCWNCRVMLGMLILCPHCGQQNP